MYDNSHFHPTPAEETEACLEAKARLLLKYAFLSILLGRQKLVYTDDVRTAAVDGVRLYVSPAFFDTLRNVAQRVFVLGHELVHLMLNHPARGAYCRKIGRVGDLPYIHKLVNIAMDYVVNDLCVEAKFGSPPPGLYHDKRIGTYKDTWEEVYARIYKQEKESGNIGTGQDGKATITGGHYAGDNTPDDVLPPANAESITQQDVDDREAKLKADAKAAMTSAKARGQEPGGVTMWIDNWLAPQVSWSEQLRAELNLSYGKDAADYNKANRRALVLPGIFLPSKKGFNLGPGICAMDSSASVTKAERRVYFPEVTAILEDMCPEVVHLIVCDAAIQSVDIIDPRSEDFHAVLEDRGKNMGGNGGTSFRPPFRYYHDVFPEAQWMIYLTDMEASFPEPEPYLQMIWVATSDIVAPWGKTIRLKW